MVIHRLTCFIDSHVYPFRGGNQFASFTEKKAQSEGHGGGREVDAWISLSDGAQKGDIHSVST